MPDLATLGIVVDAKGVVQTTDALGKLTGAGTQAEGMASKLRNTFAAFGVGLGAGVAFRAIVRESIDAQNAMAQLESAVRATGGAAGRSVAQLDDLAKALQRTTVYSDEAVMGAESVLLTFNKIGGATFDRAVRAATDLAAKFGGDLSSSAMQLGKALQEPGEALSVLQRQYRLFSAAEVESIKDMAAHGRAAEAQAAILARLESRVGGTAAAMRNTLGGALLGLKNAFGDLLEVSRDSSGGIIGFIDALARSLAWLKTHIDPVAQALTRTASLFGAGPFLDWMRMYGEAERAARGPGPMGPPSPAFVAPSAVTPSAASSDAEAARRKLRDEEAELVRVYLAYGNLKRAMEGVTVAKKVAGGWKDDWLTALEAVGAGVDRTVAQLNRLAGAEFGDTGKGGLKAAVAAAKTGAGEVGDAERTMLKDMQRAVASFFEGIFTGGVASFRDLFASVRGMWASMLSDLAASQFRGAFEGLLGGKGGFNGRSLVSGLKTVGIGLGLDLLTSALDDLFNGAARAAAAVRAFNLSLDQYRAAISGDTRAQQIAQARAEAEAMRVQANAALFRPGRQGPWLAALEEINRLEGQRILQLYTEADALQKMSQRERGVYEPQDLQVRLLRATGRDAEAERLALDLAYARERDQAILDQRDATYLNTLALVHAAEETALLTGTLRDAMRNAPSGFRVEGYLNTYAERRPVVPITQPPVFAGGASTSSLTLNGATIVVQVPVGADPERVGPALVTYLKRHGAALRGVGGTNSQTLDLM